jgi:allantoin racemase
MHLAVTLGRRFGVVTVLDSVFDMLARMAIRYGVADRMAPPRAIGIPVLELEQDLERVTRELAREAIEAVRQDGIDVVVLGCTGMLGCAAEVSRALQEHYGEYIPVIDPLPAAAAIAITSARMGVSHRRRSFASLRG